MPGELLLLDRLLRLPSVVAANLHEVPGPTKVETGHFRLLIRKRFRRESSWIVFAHQRTVVYCQQALPVGEAYLAKFAAPPEVANRGNTETARSDLQLHYLSQP